MSDGTTVPRRQLGRLLSQAREAAGMTIESASRTFEWSRAKMYRVESGDAPLRTHDITTICAVYNVAPEMKDLLVCLAKEGTRGAWWHAYGDALPPWFELYVGMEQNAMKLRQYDATLIPGMLQTPEYAEHLLRKNGVFTEEEVIAKVAIRMERQRIFTRRRPAPPKVDMIIDEAALRRPLKRRDDWLAQLNQVLRMSAHPLITVRVLPMAAGPNSTLISGSFVILDFYPVGLRNPEPSTVYCEGISGALYVDKASEVENYVRRWTVVGHDAMTPRESTDFLSTLIKEYS